MKRHVVMKKKERQAPAQATDDAVHAEESYRKQSEVSDSAISDVTSTPEADMAAMAVAAVEHNVVTETTAVDTKLVEDAPVAAAAKSPEQPVAAATSPAAAQAAAAESAPATPAAPSAKARALLVVSEHWTVSKVFLADTLASGQAAYEASKAKIFVRLSPYAQRGRTLVDAAKTKATSLAAPVLSRASQALDVARSSRDAACELALSTVTVAQKHVQVLRHNGAKAFLKESYSSLFQAAEASRAALQCRTKELADAANAKVEAAKRASEAAAAKAKATAADGHFQATVAGAAGGAVALGASGGATGFAAGGAFGAVLGLAPALFTFGLSIPIGAALGSSTGLILGAAVGSATGAISGGAVGYGTYARRADLAQGAQTTAAKLEECSNYVKIKATASAKFVKAGAAAVHTRLVGGTGGTS